MFRKTRPACASFSSKKPRSPPRFVPFSLRPSTSPADGQRSPPSLPGPPARTACRRCEPPAQPPGAQRSEPSLQRGQRRASSLLHPHPRGRGVDPHSAGAGGRFWAHRAMGTGASTAPSGRHEASRHACDRTTGVCRVRVGFRGSLSDLRDFFFFLPLACV